MYSVYEVLSLYILVGIYCHVDVILNVQIMITALPTYNSKSGEYTGCSVDPGHHWDLHELRSEVLSHCAVSMSEPLLNRTVTVNL